jgi:hypothetical protein
MNSEDESDDIYICNNCGDVDNKNNNNDAKITFSTPTTIKSILKKKNNIHIDDERKKKGKTVHFNIIERIKKERKKNKDDDDGVNSCNKKLKLSSSFVDPLFELMDEYNDIYERVVLENNIINNEEKNFNIQDNIIDSTTSSFIINKNQLGNDEFPKFVRVVNDIYKLAFKKCIFSNENQKYQGQETLYKAVSVYAAKYLCVPYELQTDDLHKELFWGATLAYCVNMLLTDVGKKSFNEFSKSINETRYLVL